MKKESPNQTGEKTLELKNSYSSSYNKNNLLYPSVDFSKLNEDQADKIREYIREIKRLDRELNKKSIVKTAKMIEIKPYNDDK